MIRGYGLYRERAEECQCSIEVRAVLYVCWYRSLDRRERRVTTPQPSAGHESQGHAVDAVTEPSRPWPILKHVALVAFTSCTVYFRSGHEEFEIGSSLDDTRINRLPEAGPTGTAVELVLR